MGTIHTNTSRAIAYLSECLNDRGAYIDIQNIATAYFNTHIDNDSYFFHELEEMIIDKIKEYKNENI
jgi:hypothetical protein